jgi:hypothetical protein
MRHFYPSFSRSPIDDGSGAAGVLRNQSLCGSVGCKNIHVGLGYLYSLIAYEGACFLHTLLTKEAMAVSRAALTWGGINGGRFVGVALRCVVSLLPDTEA